ncbi:MAG: SLBB domain-containing protein, partial [Clostridia bacterium]|nr:SLBB domain-containing protein [Clostridia bacterium]
TSYPQGAEKMLIRACTGRVVPAGKLPSDAGCVVMNVTSVAFLAKYLKTGMPLVSKRITVSGDAVGRPCNVIVPIGTSIADVIEFCGGYAKKPRKILYGGPMMGITAPNDTLPILKNTNAILAFSSEETELPPEGDCIRCGRCAYNCPMGLMPITIANAAEHGDGEKLAALNAMSCIECGSCSFVCPAHRAVLQRVRLGKTILKERKPV